MTTKNTSDKKKNTLHHQLKKVETEKKQLHRELEDKNDKLMRAIADLQNYQKRMDKELAHTADDIKRKYLCELLDVHELLKKASEDTNPQEGLKAIIKNIEKFFENEQITSIECIGKPFDHTCHHAISTLEKNDCDDGVIVDEVKKGYKIGDKILRPAQVIVAKTKKE